MSTLVPFLNQLSLQVGSVFFVPREPQAINPFSAEALAGSGTSSDSSTFQRRLDNISKKVRQASAQALLVDGSHSAEQISKLKSKMNIPVIVRLPTSMLKFENREIIELANYVEVIVHDENELKSKSFTDFLHSDFSRQHFVRKLYFLFQNIKFESAEALHAEIKNLGAPVFFEFTNYSFEKKSTYSISQVYNFIQAMYQKFGFACRPPPGRDIWDDSISSALQLEPQVDITFQIGRFDGVEHSIIIPTYNSKHYLANVIKHLAYQNISRDKYEIIVVDDGSSDGSQEYIQNLFLRHNFSADFAGDALAESINLKYIYFPRPGSRQRGDSYFRAGLSRNLGFSHSVGERLSFLDSDILVPPDFLIETKELLVKHDLIQHTRFHIKPEHSNEYIRFANVELESQTFIEEKNYWKPFFESQSWADLDMYWKYTCTYCLTLKRDDFIHFGRFRRTFVSYGFEDTDLGYRFAIAGKKFHLSKNYTLHLTPHKTQSEYQHNQFMRHTLLSKTAKKFFLNHLDPKIYEHFQIYMGGEYPFFRNMRAWF